MTEQPAPMDKRRKRVVARLAAERRRYARIRLPFAGRYLAENGWEYPCQIIDISPGGVMVTSDYPLRSSKHVVLMVEHLGRLDCEVVRVFSGGFALSICSTLRKRDRLGDALTWQLNKERLGLDEDRSSKRGKKKDKVYVQTMDGVKFLAQSADISVSGMLVETTEIVNVGEHVMIGQLQGEVTRRTISGFAVRFDLPSRPEENAPIAPPARPADENAQTPPPASATRRQQS